MNRLVSEELGAIERLIEERGKKYGDKWKAFGLVGNVVHCKEKALRFATMTRRRVPNALFVDTLQDLIVWALFALASIRAKLQPLPADFVLDRKKLYGSRDEFSAQEQFILTSKFYNALHHSFISQKPLRLQDVEDLQESLECLRKKIAKESK